MDFDNDLTKLDLPNDTAYTTFQNIWSAIQEIQQRIRVHEVDLSGSPTLPPVDRVDICLRASDSKLVALKPDGSIIDLENSAAVSDHGTKVKDDGVLISSSARPLNLPATNAITFTEDAFNDHFTIDIAGDGILNQHIGAHTSTKITITNLAQLPSSLITETNTKTMTNKTLTSPTINTPTITSAVLDANRISTYLELTKLGADPSGNPTADRMWLYVDSAENLVFENDAGVKSIISQVTFPITIAQGGTGQTSKTNAFDALAPTANDGELIYRSGGDNIALAPGTNGHILTMVSGAPAWAANAGGGGGGGTEFDYIEMARNRVGFIEDFFAITDKPNYTTSLTGTAAALNQFDVAEAGIFGVAELNTGTATTGRTIIQFTNVNTIQALRIGQGITTLEVKIKLPTLADATQDYRLVFGLCDDSTVSGANNRVWFEYDRTGSVNWNINTASGGSNSSINTSTAVGTAWVKLTIVINAAATSVEYFVNGTSVGTRTLQIPTGIDLYPMLRITKVAGTTARTCLIDYYAFQIDLTTPR